MSRNSSSLVNQKLAFARYLLRQSRQVADSAEAKLHKNALLEAAIGHLACAYRHYLHELAGYYQLKAVNRFTDEADIMACLVEEGRQGGDLQRLQELRQTPSSWLHELLAAYQASWQAPPDEPVKKAFVTGADTAERIVLVELLPDPEEELDRKVAHWCEAFGAMVTDWRQTAFES